MQSVAATRQKMNGVGSGGVCDRLSFGQRCFTIWFTLWVLIFVIVGSAYYTVWKGDNRAALIVDYNRMVDTFNAQKAAFEALTINVTTIQLFSRTENDLSPGDAAIWSVGIPAVPLTRSTPSDALSDPDAVSSGSLSAYTPVAFSGDAVWLPNSTFDTTLQFVFVINITTPSGRSSVVQSLTSGYGAFTPFHRKSLSPQEIGCETGKYCDALCQAFGGVWSYPSCTMAYMMSGACLRISQSASEPDVWEYDDSFGHGDDGGCAFFEDRLPVERYSTVEYSHSNIFPLSQSVRTWTVRLASDPWAYAGWITSGAMNFGKVTDPNAKGAAISCLTLGILPVGLLVLYAGWALHSGRWKSCSLDGILGEPMDPLDSPAAVAERRVAERAAARAAKRAADAAAGGNGSPTGGAVGMVDESAQVPTPLGQGAGQAQGAYTADVVAGMGDDPHVTVAVAKEQAKQTNGESEGANDSL